MNTQSTPVTLFVYNRFGYTMRTLEALRRNEGSRNTPLIVFADGPKHTGDPEVQTVREYVSHISGFASVELHFSDKNRGLKSSIIAGIDATLQRYERVIVLEDDIITSPYFLRYMNDALELYANDKMVAAISGNAFFEDLSLPETYFLRHTHCLGWGTWRRAWADLDRDAASLQQRLQESGLDTQLNWYGAHPDWTSMLAQEAAGELNSWAILWHTTNFLLGRLSLWPRRSLTKHIGFEQGTHCRDVFDEWSDIFPTPFPIEIRRVPVEEPPSLREKMRCFWAEHFHSYRQRLTATLRKRISEQSRSQLGV